MEFVNALGVLLLVAGVMFLVAYGIRHRGAVAKWLESIDHEDNTDEKNDEVIRLRRKKEDIDRRLEKLNEG